VPERNFDRRHCVDEQGLSQVQVQESQRNLAQLIRDDGGVVAICCDHIAAHERQI
jgi:hypothetical protein